MTEWLPQLTGAFLAVALGAYTVFGGADFGGGILEATLPLPLRRRLQDTLAPIWEANHVWLIAVVVILFVGFPAFYAALMVRLYVPVSLALLMILARGTFFTLRRYDPNPDQLRPLYDALFRGSSALAPVCFGLVIGGLLTEHPPAARSGVQADVTTLYVEPWLHPFGIVIGAFLACFFAYLAAVFFQGELELEPERRLVRRRAFSFFGGAFVLGGIVLALGAASGRVPLSHALSPWFLSCQAVAALSIVWVLGPSSRAHPWRARLAAGAQTLAILGGFLGTQYPVLWRSEGGDLTLRNASAPPVTQLWLVIGLVVVLSLVVPLLVVLYRVFDPKQRPSDP